MRSFNYILMLLKTNEPWSLNLIHSQKGIILIKKRAVIGTLSIKDFYTLVFILFCIPEHIYSLQLTNLKNIMEIPKVLISVRIAYVNYVFFISFVIFLSQSGEREHGNCNPN